MEVTLTPHRWYFPAESKQGQKLFALLELRALREDAPACPNVAAVFAFTSSKTLVRVEAVLANVAAENGLRPHDRVALCCGTDILFPLTRFGDGSTFRNALKLARGSPGAPSTSATLRAALGQLRATPSEAPSCVVLIEDAATPPDGEEHEVAVTLGRRNTPIVAIGLGERYDERLVIELASASDGRPYHVPESDGSHLKEILASEIARLPAVTVLDIRATVYAPPIVRLERLTGVYPSLFEVSIKQQPYRLGDFAAPGPAMFIFEFASAPRRRHPGHVLQLAEIGITGRHSCAEAGRKVLGVHALTTTYSDDPRDFQCTVPEVIHWLAYASVERRIQAACNLIDSDPEEAYLKLTEVLGEYSHQGGSIRPFLETIERSGKVPQSLIERCRHSERIREEERELARAMAKMRKERRIIFD